MPEEIVTLIRRIRAIEEETQALALALEGRAQGLASEAADCLRKSQVYLDQIVKQDRRREQRGDVGGRR
jgi:hypothetical protein